MEPGALHGATEEYRLFSSGKFCNNGGKVPFLVEGLFEPEDCIMRCTHAHNCAFATLYQNGWCQLGSKCVSEGEAGDASAVTYAKARTGPQERSEMEGGCDFSFCHRSTSNPSARKVHAEDSAPCSDSFRPVW